MKWKNPKHYEESLQKWESDLWKEMEDHNHLHRRLRYLAWYNIVWSKCGFCYEFGACSRCPLHPQHCDSNLLLCENHDNIINKLYNAWVKDNEKEFRKLQKEFVEVIKSYAPGVEK